MNIPPVAQRFLKSCAVLYLITSAVPFAGPGQPSLEPRTQKVSLLGLMLS